MATESSRCSSFQDGFPARWTLACISFVSFIFLYVTRVNILIAVVSMVNYTAIPHVNVSVSAECWKAPNQTEPDKTEDGEFAWDESTQALIVGSYHWGYVLTQLPGGRMSEVVGSKIMLGTSQVIAAVLTCTLPLFAEFGTGGVIAARVLLGMSQGVSFPSMQALIGKWAPPNERSGLVSFICAGTPIGTVIGMPLAGYIIEHLGWRYVFYIEGAALLLFSIVWFTCIYDSPETHPRISKNEKNYILESSQAVGVRQKAIPVPTFLLVTSPRFWAILVTQFGTSWGFSMLLSQLPIYLKNILHQDTMSNSLNSALPFLMMWVFSLICGFVSTTLLSKNICSTTVVRKIFNSIAQFGPACCLIVVAFAGCNPSLAYGLLTVSICLQGASYCGYLANIVGTIAGISGSLATIPGWVAPLTVGLLTNGNQTIERWRIAFLVTSGVMTLGAVFFLIFASGKVQPWNEPFDEKDKNDHDSPSRMESNATSHGLVKLISGPVMPIFIED